MMKKATCTLLTLLALLTITLAASYAEAKSAKPKTSVKDAKAQAAKTPKPPFGGTIFVSGNIITDDDPTSFKSVVAAGRGEVTMFDRRPGKPHKVNAYLFTATFDDGQTMEIRVNPEFGADGALQQAKKYLPYIGQMPFVLREDIEKVLIHAGKKPFGGGGKGILIHTGMGDSYIKSGILTETLYHEASHTSLDRTHSRAKGWMAAQKKDGGFISGYAKTNPYREDVAETYLMYFAVRYKPDRIDDKLKAKITKAIPNRIAYFDSLNSKMHPVKAAGELALLTTTEVQANLKLTKTQQGKIKAIAAELAGEIKKLNKQRTKIAELKSQFDTKASGVLTPAQRKTLAASMAPYKIGK
jgi:hypothetical protein